MALNSHLMYQPFRQVHVIWYIWNFIRSTFSAWDLSEISPSIVNQASDPSKMICFLTEDTRDIDWSQMMDFWKFLLSLQKMYPCLSRASARGACTIGRNHAWLQCAFTPNVGVNKELWFGFQVSFDEKRGIETNFVTVPSVCKAIFVEMTLNLKYWWKFVISVLFHFSGSIVTRPIKKISAKTHFRPYVF